VPRLRFGQDDVRLELRGSKVRFADHPPGTQKQEIKIAPQLVTPVSKSNTKSCE